MKTYAYPLYQFCALAQSPAVTVLCHVPKRRRSGAGNP
jgi:hypothetical protein